MEGLRCRAELLLQFLEKKRQAPEAVDAGTLVDKELVDELRSSSEVRRTEP